MNPSYLIGGVPENFSTSARLTDSNFFIIEADEYDTAFFDKRSKFVHYHPRTLVMNNLEFDHADIFEDLAAIEKQFHHVVRIVPSLGRVISNGDDENVSRVLQKGVWSEQARFGLSDNEGFHAELLEADGSHLRISYQGQQTINTAAHPPRNETADLVWKLTGQHNAYNALAAIAAAEHVGVTIKASVAALATYQGVKRRMELIADVEGVKVFDDFAHHPTAIASTLAGAKAHIHKNGHGRLIAVIEPRSNTMKMGVHQQNLIECVRQADQAYWFMAEQNWGLSDEAGIIMQDLEALLAAVTDHAQAGDHIVVMSNGGFSGFHQKLVSRLSAHSLNTI
jgi:UDP-N-acetylmuramate: L-alanyl-gamma-D-glutamyl-meso-diaminopimelate ligase